MKFLICLLLVVTCALALTDEQRQKFKKIADECVTETGVPLDLVLKIRNERIFTDDPKLKKYVDCVLKKTDLMTDSGDFVSDALKAKLKRVVTDDAEVDKIVNKCVVKHDTAEETAFAIMKCVTKQKPEFSPAD